MTADRILTVSLNAAVDVSYIVEQFAVGKINTVREVARTAGGKANNVARVLAALGQPVLATGFVGGSSGHFIRSGLERQGVETQYEEFDGENRTCTAIMDPAGRTLTEIRERGPQLTEQDADRFLSKFTGLLDRAKLVILSGSLPQGIVPDFYAKLVRTAYRKTQVRTIVDAAGKVLKGVLPAQPYMVKPNREELEEWAGRRLPDDHSVLSAARALMQAGPLVVAVSLGPDGLLLVSPEGAWRAVPPVVPVVNTVGCGDALIAGFVTGLMERLPAEGILQLAVACGTANALTREAGVVHVEDVDRIRRKVRVERVQ